MPWIIDYQLVLEQMRQQRFKCLYYNSGAFGFPDDVPAQSIGWIGPPDETIRAEMQKLTRKIPPPFEGNLAQLATRAWQDLLPVRVWVMPKSHWAYELDFGSREWMPEVLENIGLDPGMLVGRNNAAAIEFTTDEQQPFTRFVQRLLMMLQTSDFLLAFPNHSTVCTIHSHKQLWWTTADPQIASALDNLTQLDNLD